MWKKPKVYQCDCCKNIITDPYLVKMREFYYRQDFKQVFGMFIKSKTTKIIRLCSFCYAEIGMKDD